jgi:hypothetical protein
VFDQLNRRRFSARASRERLAPLEQARLKRNRTVALRRIINEGHKPETAAAGEVMIDTELYLRCGGAFGFAMSGKANGGENNESDYELSPHDYFLRNGSSRDSARLCRSTLRKGLYFRELVRER